ncbi:hypothetical protein QJQ45_002064 [Haematococcus lacustris]|nr:hypothetical protein QJQ45_002064 [Haematococcus lacustris]
MGFLRDLFTMHLADPLDLHGQPVYTDIPVSQAAIPDLNASAARVGFGSKAPSSSRTTFAFEGEEGSHPTDVPLPDNDALEGLSPHMAAPPFSRQGFLIQHQLPSAGSVLAPHELERALQCVSSFLTDLSDLVLLKAQVMSLRLGDVGEGGRAETPAALHQRLSPQLTSLAKEGSVSKLEALVIYFTALDAHSRHVLHTQAAHFMRRSKEGFLRAATPADDSVEAALLRASAASTQVFNELVGLLKLEQSTARPLGSTSKTVNTGDLEGQNEDRCFIKHPELRPTQWGPTRTMALATVPEEEISHSFSGCLAGSIVCNDQSSIQPAHAHAAAADRPLSFTPGSATMPRIPARAPEPAEQPFLASLAVAVATISTQLAELKQLSLITTEHVAQLQAQMPLALAVKASASPSMAANNTLPCIDAGSAATMLTTTLTQQMQLHLMPCQQRGIQSGGVALQVLGAVMVEVGLGVGGTHRALSRHRALVVADTPSLPYNALIGTDVFYKHGVQLDMPGRLLSYAPRLASHREPQPRHTVPLFFEFPATSSTELLSLSATPLWACAALPEPASDGGAASSSGHTSASYLGAPGPGRGMDRPQLPTRTPKHQRLGAAAARRRSKREPPTPSYRQQVAAMFSKGVTVRNLCRALLLLLCALVPTTALGSVLPVVSCCGISSTLPDGKQHLPPDVRFTKHAKGMLFGNHPGMLATQRVALQSLVKAHDSAFSYSLSDLPGYHGPRPPLCIPLTTEQPVRSPPRRYSPIERQICQDKTTELQAAGIVFSVEGPCNYAAAPVLPAKKDVHGNWTKKRFAIDFRQLNTATKPDIYGLPRPDEMFSELGDSCFFSKLDMRNGFFQLVIAPTDRINTTFWVGVHFIKVDSRVPHGVCKQLGLTKETLAVFTSEPALSHHWARWFNTGRLANKGFEFERTVETDGVSVCVHYTRPLPPPPAPPPAAGSSSSSPSAAAAAAHAVGLPHIDKGIAEQREFVFDPDTQIGVGIDPGVTQAVSAAWDPQSGQLKADQLRRWKLTKGQVKHASGLDNARRDTERWLAPIKPHLQHLAAASSAGTSLEANLKHITVTLATWVAVWEVYLDPKWARQRLRLYGAQDRALEQFFNALEEDMVEVSMERHGRAKQLVVFFGAAGIGTGGGGPTQAPRSSQAAAQPAASKPGPSTPPPAKRSKRTKAEQAAEPTQPTKAAKAKPAPQPGRWLDRDCNAALNMQRIGESRWGPLELCYWPDQGALPAKGKEYPGLGYKRLQDKLPKAQEQQPPQPAVAQQCVPPS